MSIPAPKPDVTSRGLSAPTYTRPIATSTASTRRDPDEAGREGDCDDAGDRHDEDHVPGGEARARLGHVAAQDRTRLARARPLTDREVSGDLVPHHPLDDQLRPVATTTPMATPRSPSTTATVRPGEATDHEVPELHREPKDRIEPVRQAIDPAEDGDLDAEGSCRGAPRRSRAPGSPRPRRGEGPTRGPWALCLRDRAPECLWAVPSYAGRARGATSE